jgi:hypothetical protein
MKWGLEFGMLLILTYHCRTTGFLTLFVFLFPHPAWADSKSSGNTSVAGWGYVIIAICEYLLSITGPNFHRISLWFDG